MRWPTSVGTRCIVMMAEKKSSRSRSLSERTSRRTYLTMTLVAQMVVGVRALLDQHDGRVADRGEHHTHARPVALRVPVDNPLEPRARLVPVGLELLRPVRLGHVVPRIQVRAGLDGRVLRVRVVHAHVEDRHDVGALRELDHVRAPVGVCGLLLEERRDHRRQVEVKVRAERRRALPHRRAGRAPADGRRRQRGVRGAQRGRVQLEAAVVAHQPNAEVRAAIPDEEERQRERQPELRGMRRSTRRRAEDELRVQLRGPHREPPHPN